MLDLRLLEARSPGSVRLWYPQLTLPETDTCGGGDGNSDSVEAAGKVHTTGSAQRLLPVLPAQICIGAGGQTGLRPPSHFWRRCRRFGTRPRLLFGSEWHHMEIVPHVSYVCSHVALLALCLCLIGEHHAVRWAYLSFFCYQVETWRMRVNFGWSIV